MPRTALVLSGGGMFGAYQAGAWLVLEEALKPDIVVGASVGSLNGWAIASGMPAAQLVETWLEPARAERPRLKFPQSLRDGLLNAEILESWIHHLHTSWKPRLPIGIALTEMWEFRPVLVQNGEITWRHLAASCAVPGLFPQCRIDGRCFADGGLLTPLPLWGALEMGAERIVAINVLPVAGAPLFALCAGLVRIFLGSRRLERAPDIETVIISPEPPLGTPAGTIFWNRRKTEEWIARGRQDMLAKKHLICDMF